MSKIQHLFQLISRRPQQEAMPFSGFYPVRSASELLEPHRELVDKIRQYFGVPETVWALTHERLIRNFARRVQLLPASEADLHTEPGGLLRLSLETANHAMKIRRGYMLPNGTSTECISEQQEIWSFAVLCAALLHGIGKPFTEVMISLQDHKDSESHWLLACDDMPADSSYRPEFCRKRTEKHHQSIALLVTGQIIPKTALQWLSQYPDVFDLWLLTLSGRYTEAGMLGEIITKAVQYATGKSLMPNKKNKKTEEAYSPSSTSEKRFGAIDLKSIGLPPGRDQLEVGSIDSQIRDAENQRLQSETESESHSSDQPAARASIKREHTGKKASRRAREELTGQQFLQRLRQQIVGGKSIN